MFGRTFLPDDHEKPRQPMGFVVARVSLGVFSERLFCDESVWNADDYISHWRISAQRCVDGSEGELFCSSLSRGEADLHVGVRNGRDLTFDQMHVPTSQLSIDGGLVRPVALFSYFVGVSSPAWSRWDVNMGAVAAFIPGPSRCDAAQVRMVRGDARLHGAVVGSGGA